MASKLQSGQEDRESDGGKHFNDSVRNIYGETEICDEDAVFFWESIAFFPKPCNKMQSKLFTKCLHCAVYDSLLILLLGAC